LSVAKPNEKAPYQHALPLCIVAGLYSLLTFSLDQPI